MRRPALSLLLLTIVVPFARAQDNELSRLKKELMDVELAVEKSRYDIPSCAASSPEDDFAAFLTQQATKLSVRDFTVKRLDSDEVVPSADGQPSPYRLRRLDISGHGDFYDVHSLLHRIGSAYLLRVETIETLHLQARAGGDVRMDARLAEACWGETPAAGRLPAGRSVEEIELAAYRERLQRLRGWLSTNAQLRERMQPKRLVEALEVLEDHWGPRALLLDDLQYTAPALTLHGATLGGVARASVDEALKRAGLQPATVDWSPAGECRAFTISTRVAGGRTDKADLVPMNVFDERMTTLCSTAPRPPATPVTARGTGDLTLHLRDVPAATVFQILADLSPADAFIVESSVTARVDADLDRVTPGEAFAALRAAGVAVVGRGPLHRVCKTECSAGPPEPPKYTGQSIALTVTDAQVVDVLRVFNQLMAPIQIYGPPKIDGTFSIYAADVPWDRMFDGILAATGRKYTFDEPNARVYITDDRATAVPIDKARSGGGGTSRRELAEHKPEKIAVDDVRVAALARGKDGVWTAYGRAPGARNLLFALTPGLALFDGTVDAVGAEGVTLRTSSGRTITIH